MKTFIKSFIISSLLVVGCFAQAPTSVQQSATKLDAALLVGTSNTSAATITLTPLGSQSIYIYEIDIVNCATGSAVSAAATTSITTTNLPGSPVWTMGSGTTAGACVQNIVAVYPTGLKAATPGTAVTVVLPTFATNQKINVNVAYSSAP